MADTAEPSSPPEVPSPEQVQERTEEARLTFRPCNPEQQERCDKFLQKSFKNSSFVQFMLKNLEDVGCKVDVDKFFVCSQCDISAAYDAGHGEIVLCENNIYNSENMANVVTHELIHAYDDCRANVDFHDIRHLACTEIRAASLSGDCFFTNEVLNRLNLGVRKQHQVCVKRRAALSLEAVLGVSRTVAMQAIDEVYDMCFKDTAPFDMIP
eukprot:TRINITY_DN11584_c0_g13_i1.p1 TRINITY_DN11584_c0_g13~~TRINITY_DN11584_c0_g13_i1.p1  ORF type:complete len:211 (+),score=48.25 TRINITY_DN11584_c0_g13_i1:100-732(+)